MGKRLDDEEMVTALGHFTAAMKRRANAIVTEGGPAAFAVSTGLLILAELAGAAADTIEVMNPPEE